MPEAAPTRRAPPAPRRRPAYSLVEVVAAIGLMTATLVPAMELVRDGVVRSAETDRRQLLALYAVSELEKQLAAAAATWATGAYSGDYAADGHADLRFDAAVSDDALNGGVPGLLMDLRVTAYHDANGDDVQGAGEMSCTYRTKLGHFVTYEVMAL